MKLKDFNEKKRPVCEWRDCNEKALGLLSSMNPGEFIALCPKHYKIARMTKQVDLK